MTLLQQALQRYPVGIRYKDAAHTKSGTELIVETQSFQEITIGSVVWGESGKGCLYYDGRWAEIIQEHYEIY